MAVETVNTTSIQEIFGSLSQQDLIEDWLRGEQQEECNSDSRALALAPGGVEGTTH